MIQGDYLFYLFKESASINIFFACVDLNIPANYIAGKKDLNRILKRKKDKKMQSMNNIIFKKERQKVSFVFARRVTREEIKLVPLIFIRHFERFPTF